MHFVNTGKLITGRNEVGTSVCQEFCPQGEGVCLSAFWDTPREHTTPRDQTPPDQTPP